MKTGECIPKQMVAQIKAIICGSVKLWHVAWVDQSATSHHICYNKLWVHQSPCISDTALVTLYSTSNMPQFPGERTSPTLGF